MDAKTIRYTSATTSSVQSVVVVIADSVYDAAENSCRQCGNTDYNRPPDKQMFDVDMFFDGNERLVDFHN